MNLDNFMQTVRTRLEQLIRTYLIERQLPAPKLQEAMAYMLLNSGKFIRPTLIYLTGRVLKASWEKLDVPALALEFMHTYSLIHDDLPAMDNADLRRGNLTCHKMFGDALAILAGDALQPLAFSILTSHPARLNTRQRLNMIAVLSHACGVQGMAAGQALDLAGATSIETLMTMYQLKTGALLTASVKMGAIAAGNENSQVHAALQKFAESIGLAFQIQDDLLDLESTAQTTGKPAGLDRANKKITYPMLMGVEISRQKVQELFTQALRAIDFLKTDGQLLQEFAHSLLARKK